MLISASKIAFAVCKPAHSPGNTAENVADFHTPHEIDTGNRLLLIGKLRHHITFVVLLVFNVAVLLPISLTNEDKRR